MLLLLGLLTLNFVISIYNAWSCGLVWASTSKKGGLAHFMTWMGAVMSACGFTWVYTAVLAYVSTVIPVKGEDGEYHALLTAAQAHQVLELGYLVIIFPVLGSGLALMVRSWRSFARSRSFGDGAVAGWNTYAQFSNMYDAMRLVPDIFGRIGGLLDSKGGDGKGKVIIALVVLAVAGGIGTTFAIIRYAARGAVEEERRFSAGGAGSPAAVRG